MHLFAPWAFIFCVSACLLLLGATAGLINSRLWVSEPLACVFLGILLGPACLGLVALPVGETPDATAFMREAARITLTVAVIGAAMRVPRGWMRRQWRGMALVLGPGMVLMWAAGVLVTWLTFGLTLGLPLLLCVLVGAAVSPTDPVLAAPIVSGSLANDMIPPALRHGITAESGANDGLALPFVMLPILLLQMPRGAALSTWVLHVILWQVGVSVAFGLFAGWLTDRCVKWADRHYDVQTTSVLGIVLALGLMTLAAMRVIGADGILAAFVAGVALNEGVEGEAAERQDRFNEAIGRFFDLPIMVLFGVAAPWRAWYALGWPGVAFAVGILLLRRLPAWFVMHRLIPWTRHRADAIFYGWFGPIGVAAVFYACHATEQTGAAQLWPIISLAVAASVLAHGTTGTPLARFLGRAFPREERPAR
ncbi:MAG TPA: cation:proton antiporter [Rhodopila sp.]|nr:cation:proton antiporter [Rhodopila sp.]